MGGERRGERTGPVCAITHTHSLTACRPRWGAALAARVAGFRATRFTFACDVALAALFTRRTGTRRDACRPRWGAAFAARVAGFRATRFTFACDVALAALITRKTGTRRNGK